MKLQKGKFRLNMRRCISATRTIRQWNKLLGKVMELQLLKIFQARLNTLLLGLMKKNPTLVLGREAHSPLMTVSFSLKQITVVLLGCHQPDLLLSKKDRGIIRNSCLLKEPKF